MSRATVWLCLTAGKELVYNEVKRHGEHVFQRLVYMDEDGMFWNQKWVNGCLEGGGWHESFDELIEFMQGDAPLTDWKVEA